MTSTAKIAIFTAANATRKTENPINATCGTKTQRIEQQTLTKTDLIKNQGKNMIIIYDRMTGSFVQWFGCKKSAELEIKKRSCGVRFVARKEI